MPVIQPVARALAVLRTLNHHPHASLAALHFATGLPKPTLHRLLATLKAEGYVRSDVALGVYSLTAKVRELSEGFTDYERVVEIGGAIVMKATRDSGAPMAIGVLHNGRIAVRYSSMPYSPIAPEHTTLGHTHDLLNSGMGQAYIAYCSTAERTQLERQLVDACPGATAARDLRREIAATVSITRKRGYGLRLPERRTGTATLAVPIAGSDGLLGVLSVTTFGRLLDARAERDYAQLLQRISAEITKAVNTNVP